MSTFEVDVYARKFFPQLPPAMGRQVASEAVSREVERRAGRPYEQFVQTINERRVTVPCARQFKNGVLVHRAGRKITNTDVRDAGE